MNLEPETILKNRYRIIHLLGKGGMGAVYLGYDQNLEIEVAIKSNHDHSPESTSQFLQEARMLAALHHPNLPRVIDHFLLDNDEYLVMDYIKGQDLQNVLDQTASLPLDVVLAYARQLGNAVHFLHAQNPPIIHRDIKPANIKVDQNGNCILVDFGIAKTGSAAQATSAGAKGYTPGYAPPEQYGNTRTGPYSDQYSLAATLFHLLTGQRPADSVQRALGQAILTPINILKPGLPAHIAPVFERALSIKPNDRFASVNEFIRALLDPGYVPSLTGPSDYNTLPIKSKNTPKWLILVLGGVLLLGIIIGGVFALPFIFKPNHAQDAALIQPNDTQLAAPISDPDTQTPQIQPTEPIATATSQPTLTATATLSPTLAMEMIGGGGKIAFVSNRSADGLDQIWTMNIFMDGNGTLVSDDPQQLTFDAFGKEQPAWSPDGSKLIYAAEGDPASGSIGKEIWMLDLTQPETPAKNLTYQKGDDFDPVFSPDGKYIAFTNKGRYNDVRQIYFMTVDGREMRRLSLEFDEYAPFWSPEMDLLINIIEGSGHRYLFKHVWTGDIYPTPYPTPRPFDPTTIFGQLGEVTDPVLSKDGTYLAYARIDGKLYQIYSMETKYFGAKKTLLTADSNYNRWPEWSPDGQWILYTSKDIENTQEEIFIMTSTGLLKTNLTMHAANDRQPAWQPITSD